VTAITVLRVITFVTDHTYNVVAPYLRGANNANWCSVWDVCLPSSRHSSTYDLVADPNNSLGL